jgi:hypothetical protein
MRKPSPVKWALVASLPVALVFASTASATTQWFYDRVPIAQGKTVKIASSGKLQVTVKPGAAPGIKIPCEASGIEAFWNTPEGGLDKTRSIGFVCASTEACPEPVVTPYLPWTSRLLESEPPLVDEWEGMALEVACGVTNYGLFTGALETTVGDVDPEGSSDEGEGGKDDIDDTMKFRGGMKKALTGSTPGLVVWFTGTYFLGSKGGATGVSDKSGD